MVNKLSDLADFLDNDSLPPWLKEQLKEKREEITAALEKGESITLPAGPNGERVTIGPKPVAAVA
jgi:hypothetical protein